MSEAMAGVPAAPPPSTPRDASAVILYRRTATGPEVFWLKRDKGLRFAGGFYAFPGGKVDEADATVPVEGAEGPEAQQVVAAARELFEETGVLLVQGQPHLPLAELRTALLAEKLSFATLILEQHLTLRAADFKLAGRWVTPEFIPNARFDARFFLAELPVGQSAEVWPGELSEGAWVRPAEALSQWEAGTALLHPPNMHALQVMGAFRDEASAVESLRGAPGLDARFISSRIEFQRGVKVMPLRTATLPPATHTNSYILGTRQLLVVDPGSDDHREIDALIARLEELRSAEGCTLEAIVLTHHHGDHIGGVERLVEKLQLPIWAHEKTAERIGWPVAKRLREGTVIELDGPLPMNWRVLHTPGHARGHVTLIDERTKAAVVGDMVAGVGTIVIDPPEGDMTEYLSQLLRLRALVGTIYPAHGPAIPNGAEKLDEYLAHRAWREAKVLEALRTFTEPASVSDLVARAYDDVAAFVWPIAERNTIAILEKLAREGSVIPSPGGASFRAA